MNYLLKSLILVSLLSVCSATVQVGVVICGDSTSWPVVDPSDNWKEAVRDVRFARTFAATPQIMLAPKLIDVEASKNMRYNLYVKNVSTEGFQVVCLTWNDTHFFKFEVFWQASI